MNYFDLLKLRSKIPVFASWGLTKIKRKIVSENFQTRKH